MQAYEFTRLKPMMLTRALRESVSFYVENLGFEVEAYNEDWGWASLVKDGVSVSFARPAEGETAFQEPKFTGSFYIQCEEVDELWELLRDKVTICYPIDNFNHGMREFGIFDNNGYILQFGKPIDLAALAAE